MSIRQENVTVGEQLSCSTRRGWLVCGRSRVPVVIQYDIGDADTADWDQWDWADHYSNAEIDVVQAELDGLPVDEVAACASFFHVTGSARATR